jgi:hypothetical protein
VSTRAYIGARFTVVGKDVLVVTCKGTHVQPLEEFDKAGPEILMAMQERNNIFVEPEMANVLLSPET